MILNDIWEFMQKEGYEGLKWTNKIRIEALVDPRDYRPYDKIVLDITEGKVEVMGYWFYWPGKYKVEKITEHKFSNLKEFRKILDQYTVSVKRWFPKMAKWLHKHGYIKEIPKEPKTVIYVSPDYCPIDGEARIAVYPHKVALEVIDYPLTHSLWWSYKSLYYKNKRELRKFLDEHTGRIKSVWEKRYPNRLWKSSLKKWLQKNGYAFREWMRHRCGLPREDGFIIHAEVKTRDDDEAVVLVTRRRAYYCTIKYPLLHNNWQTRDKITYNTIRELKEFLDKYGSKTITSKTEAIHKALQKL